MSFLLAVLILFTALALTGRFNLLDDYRSDATIKPIPPTRQLGKERLFVYVHGMDGGKNWSRIEGLLLPYGDAVMLVYDQYSNADPVVLSRQIASQIEEITTNGKYQFVTILGRSMGALLVKRAILHAKNNGLNWVEKLTRVVLVAGMNRGWDITGHKPSDMSQLTRWSIWFGTWLSRLIGFPTLPLSMEAGSPFVANIRLDWLKRMTGDSAGYELEVVQLLGDIDDWVSAEDNTDLKVIKGKFAWLKVRGTGHSNIIDFDDGKTYGKTNLGDYRKGKFMMAATLPFENLVDQNEVLPHQPDPDVTHLVFVLHGIRDLGDWAAAFEAELQRRFHERTIRQPGEKLTIASSRYGYFGMGPFLLKPIRQRYVRWFMDEFTEVVASYPNLREVHFVGHSNGTYLLASSLKTYSSMKVDKVVFGGSVVHKSYDWEERFNDGQLEKLLNYQADNDWVVALFPRFFEPPFWQWALDNDIGSAGFNGFDVDHISIDEIRFIPGGHGAFLTRIDEIANYLFPDKSEATFEAGRPAVEKPRWYLELASNWATWFLVWPFLVVFVVYIGWHVIIAAPEPRWPMALIYIALLWAILRNF